MGKFTQLLENLDTNPKKYHVKSKDQDGKEHSWTHEGRTLTSLHRTGKFDKRADGGDGHTLISVKHNGKDVTKDFHASNPHGNVDNHNFNESASITEDNIRMGDKVKIHHPEVYPGAERAGWGHGETGRIVGHGGGDRHEVKLDDGTKAYVNAKHLRPHNESTVKFHHLSSMPHKEVRMQDDHREAIHKMTDGKSHSSSQLITTYNHHGDSGTSHFVTSHREGNVIHLRDAHTKKHVATVSHADTAEHNPNKTFKFLPD
jgi:hypothetical protein